MERDFLKYRWRLWLIISVLTSAASMGILFTLTVTSSTLDYFLKIPIELIILAATAHVFSWFFWALRIKILAKSLNVEISFSKCFKIVLVNLFLACVTPSGMGGEPARILMLREYTGSGSATAITVGERIIDFVFFGAAFAILLFLLGINVNVQGVEYYLVGVAIILGASFGVFLYLVHRRYKFRRILKKLEKLMGIFIKDSDKRAEIMRKMEMEYDAFFAGTFAIFRKKGYLALTFLFTVLMWIVDFLIPSLLLLGLGFNPHWIFILTSMIIIVLVTILPITPGGSGLAEFTGYFLFSQIVPLDVAAIIVILWRVITFYPNLLLGLFYTLHHISNNGGE